MTGWIVGALLVIVGLAGVTNAIGVVESVARIWPRDYRRGDAGLFASSNFLLRFVSLMVLASGAAVLWLAATG